MIPGFNISKKHNLLFVHIPRTGGSSVKRALLAKGIFPPDYKVDINLADRYGLWDDIGNWVHHLKPEKVQRLLKYADLTDEPIGFTIIRNPWARAVSTFFFMKEHGFPQVQGLVCQAAIKQGKCLWGKQESWLKKPVDVVLRTESLDEDFPAFCKLFDIEDVNIPHAGQTSHSDYRKYFDDESRQVIAEKERFVIEKYNYKF